MMCSKSDLFANYWAGESGKAILNETLLSTLNRFSSLIDNKLFVSFSDTVEIFLGKHSSAPIEKLAVRPFQNISLETVD